MIRCVANAKSCPVNTTFFALLALSLSLNLSACMGSYTNTPPPPPPRTAADACTVKDDDVLDRKLLLAVAGNNTKEIVRQIIKDFPDTLHEASTNTGRTALVCAVQIENAVLTRVLLEEGADPNSLYGDKTVFQVALQQMNDDVVYAFMETLRTDWSVLNGMKKMNPQHAAKIGSVQRLSAVLKPLLASAGQSRISSAFLNDPQKQALTSAVNFAVANFRFAEGMPLEIAVRGKCKTETVAFLAARGAMLDDVEKFLTEIATSGNVAGVQALLTLKQVKAEHVTAAKAAVGSKSDQAKAAEKPDEMMLKSLESVKKALDAFPVAPDQQGKKV